jgi:Universal stress protein family
MLGVHRIVAGVSGSPGSVHALRHTAELARRHDAVLIPLLA